MRPKSLLLLVLALGCGLVASIGISQVLDSNNKNSAAIETVPIYVALQNINLGDPVNDAMVSLQEWPKDKIPVGALTKWEEIEDRRPRTAIFQGEPLLDGKFLEKGQIQDPISAIPYGMRLKTVSVDARKSAAGLLSPGDRVDLQIFVRRNEREQIPHPFTKIILQNIRVFAVDQEVQRSSDGAEARTVAKTVSLVVTPDQANRIATAENLGEISLIPRHPDDDKIVDDLKQTTEFIFGKSDANSRRLEQGMNREGSSDGGVAGLVRKQMEFQSIEELEPPFRMRMIFPDEVSVIHFSNETGEPLEETDVGIAGSVGAGSDYPVPAPGADGDSSADDFPIDLRLKY